MTTIYGLGNGVELDLDNLSAAESDEEDRENEIKQLLEGALNNETFYDDDESEASFAQSSIHQHENENEVSIHSLRLNPNLANVSTNGFSFLNGYNDQVNNNNEVRGLEIQKRLTDSRPLAGEQTNRGVEEIEAQNATVSLMHKKHCPQQHPNLGNGNGNGDSEDGSQAWRRTSNTNDMEQLKQLCEFRDRQIVRSEETISTLTKDKRALNHHLALMRSEMIQMKGTQDELEKSLRLKDEEIEYMKSKIEEAIAEFEHLKRGEADMKDDNNRLKSEISRLEQEVKLAGTIGSSVQQTEVNTVVRQIRDKHAREIASWKSITAELEGQIRVLKKSEKIFQANSPTAVDINNASTQTQSNFTSTSSKATQFDSVVDKQNKMTSPAAFRPTSIRNTSSNTEKQTQDSEEDLYTFFEEEKTKLKNFYEQEIDEYKTRLTELPAKLYSAWQQNAEHLSLTPKPLVLNAATMTQMNNNKCDASISCEIISPYVGQRLPPTAEILPIGDVKDSSCNKSSQLAATSLRASPSKIIPSTSTFVQTEETLKTYEILAGLIEQWSEEVSDSAKRAELAETQARYTEDSLKKLRKRFKEVAKMVAVCRKEWKTQEHQLKKKHAETKSHYINLLLNLGQKLESLEELEDH